MREVSCPVDPTHTETVMSRKGIPKPHHSVLLCKECGSHIQWLSKSDARAHEGPGTPPEKKQLLEEGEKLQIITKRSGMYTTYFCNGAVFITSKDGLAVLDFLFRADISNGEQYSGVGLASGARMSESPEKITVEEILTGIAMDKDSWLVVADCIQELFGDNQKETENPDGDSGG